VKTVLVIKTSSLGDVIHTLPALSDAQRALGDIQFDWVVEENFAEIPAWHPAVRQIIPVALRRWRKSFFKSFFSPAKDSEWHSFKRHLQSQCYDAVIDAQGLLKSAVLSRLSCGERYGLDKHSARESLASYFYQHPQAIAKGQHAVERVRQLFAKSLAYDLDGLPLDYGLHLQETGLEKKGLEKANSDKNKQENSSNSILFLHGTTWQSKHWPEQYWLDLTNKVTALGYCVLLPWGNDSEYQRALKLQTQCHKSLLVHVLDKMTLNELAQKIRLVDAVVAVDTGLAHLAAALDRPTIALYGATSSGLTGTYGQNQQHLQSDFPCAPCFNKHCVKSKQGIIPECYTALSPEHVILALHSLLNESVKK